MSNKITFKKLNKLGFKRQFEGDDYYWGKQLDDMKNEFYTGCFMLYFDGDKWYTGIGDYRNDVDLVISNMDELKMILKMCVIK